MDKRIGNALLRAIPAVNELLQDPRVQHLCELHSRSFVLNVLTQVLDGLREEIRDGGYGRERLEQELGKVVAEVEKRIGLLLSPSLYPVVNATGVIVFTNAGRAPLSRAVMEKVLEVSCSYSNLEYDLGTGRRGLRDFHLEKRARLLFDCEAASVCNNAAAALLLILNTLADGRKVLVSRGELIEIGGSFRIPAILEKSGAILKEVGTTNRTRASDFREAVDEDTALILRVHTSNYRIVGFTQRPSLAELVEVAKEKGVWLVDDIGSGCVSRSDHAFLAGEPTILDSLRAGSDLVCFSGDKLLGGPQAGLILGRKQLVDRIRKNPLMRACRADKMAYAALEWTLMEYQRGTHERTLPVWRFIGLTREELMNRLQALKDGLSDLGYRADIVEGASLTGGGSAPEETIPTPLLAVDSAALSVNDLERGLLAHSPPIIARIESDRLLLDLRTVFPEQDQALIEAFRRIAS